MLHKTLTILSLIGLLLNVGTWATSGTLHSGSSYWYTLAFTHDRVQAKVMHGMILFCGVVFLACSPFHHYRRRKRLKLGLCVKCGYDLRASKGRCPECGQECET